MKQSSQLYKPELDGLRVLGFRVQGFRGFRVSGV